MFTSWQAESGTDESDSLSGDSSEEVEIDHLINHFGFGLYQVRLLLITGKRYYPCMLTSCRFDLAG